MGSVRRLAVPFASVAARVVSSSPASRRRRVGARCAHGGRCSTVGTVQRCPWSWSWSGWRSGGGAGVHGRGRAGVGRSGGAGVRGRGLGGAGDGGDRGRAGAAGAAEPWSGWCSRGAPYCVKPNRRSLNGIDTLRRRGARCLRQPGASPMPASRTFIAYLRVSTDKQGRSGLGLEAQQAAIDAFLRPGDRLLEPPHIEVESGKNADRPKLREALERCRKTGATLLIARLDRLARNVRFISTLMEQGVPFLACDMPTATPFMLHIYAAVAEEEARAISRRTKAALAAAKARGVKLGGDRGYRPATAPDGRLGAEASKRQADQAATALAPILDALRAAGASSLHQLAAGLQARGVATPRGGVWTATAVRRALARIP